MDVVTWIMAGLASLVHGYIFWLESVRWEHPATRRIFGTSPEEAALTRQLAYNQGFYNLFLALAAAAGVVLWQWTAVSVTLLAVSLGSMLLAAVVLVTNDRTKARAALVQGLFPALGLASLALASIG